MTKHIKPLFVLLVLLSFTAPVSLAHARGGLVLQPYWAFETEAPVTHVRAGDVDGDGLKDIVITTADRWVRVLENDGDLIWEYETLFVPSGLLVDDLDGDETTAEIIVHGEGQEILLSHSKRPVWTYVADPVGTFNSETPVDLNRDGRLEVVGGSSTGVVYVYDPATSRTIMTRSIGTQEQTVTDLWVGDTDDDGRFEIVSRIDGDSRIFVLDDDFTLAWISRIEGEVGLLSGGDVDGDGQAEVAVLSASWDLFLLEGDGSQVWQAETLSGRDASADPAPGQLAVRDLDGDGRAEIVVMTQSPTAAVHVFDGDGRQVWKHSLGSIFTSAKLSVDDINGDGKSEVVVTTSGQAQVYLLDAAGQRLAEYRIPGTTGALGYVDLNGDGWGEVIVGAQTGVQIFTTSDQVVRRELWQSPRLGFMAALLLSDLEGDGQGEVLAGSISGRVHAMADEGHILWEVDLGEPVWALSAGDMDGDARSEIVAGTWEPMQSRGGGKVHLLDGDQLVWSASIGGGIINSVAVADLDGDEQPEIMVGSGQTDGQVTLLSGGGNLIWEREFDQAVTAVYGADGGQVVAGTQNGRIYRLLADGSPAGQYDLAAKVLSLDARRVLTADGRVYLLGDDEPTLVHDLGKIPKTAQLSAESVAVLIGEQEVGLVASDGSNWKGTVNGPAFSIAAGDLNGDGEPEIAVSTEERVHFLGTALNQPPLITEPDVVDTRAGYAYSVYVNDPDGDAVAVTLEIWDPSAGVWITQPTQTLAQGQGPGRLAWDVPDPFDTWDSGRDSRFRLRHDDGLTQGTTAEIPGPTAIPTEPWYLYYGWRAGLGALVLLTLALNLLLHRCQCGSFGLWPFGRGRGTSQGAAGRLG